MNKYTIALNRLLTPKKYPLYRTTPLRYVFLHLLLISLLMSAPGLTNSYLSISSFSQLVQEKERDIPDFQMVDHQLELPDDREQTIPLKGGTITFTEQRSGRSSDIVTFTKDKLYIQSIAPITYSSLNMMDDKTSMIKQMKIYTQSSFFYFLLIALVLIIVQLTITIIKVSCVSLAAHGLASIARRKSRFMNWFKITAFLLTVPALVQYMNLLVPNALFNPLSWCIMILLVSIAGWYLPRKKTGK
ncbi:DUF1189 family protein [Macrococcus equipercicus]|nr:DUF1189 family protein [Macrococcus equipercicus]UTH12959.1 DUF1189 family protein [Macrococcus equipercicus]